MTVGRSTIGRSRYGVERGGAGEPSRQIASPVPPPPPARIPPVPARRGHGVSWRGGPRQSVSYDLRRGWFHARRAGLRPHEDSEDDSDHYSDERPDDLRQDELVHRP